MILAAANATADDVGRLVGIAVVAVFSTWMSFVICRGFASLRWPSTIGKVLSSEVGDMFHRTDGDGDFHHAIRYEYVVEGRRYVGNRVYVGPRLHYDFASEVEPLAKAFSEGASTRVYFDPSRPAYSVLQPGPKLAHALALLGALGSAVCLVWPWVFG
jgi:hypothetical protein